MARVAKIEPAGQADVYNIEVESAHNYAICGGIVVKNCDALRYMMDGRPRHRPIVPREGDYERQIGDFLDYGG